MKNWTYAYKKIRKCFYYFLQPGPITNIHVQRDQSRKLSSWHKKKKKSNHIKFQAPKEMNVNIKTTKKTGTKLLLLARQFFTNWPLIICTGHRHRRKRNETRSNFWEIEIGFFSKHLPRNQSIYILKLAFLIFFFA